MRADQENDCLSQVRLIDDEVQKFVTQKHAPPPKKMPKPQRRSSLENVPVSSPVKCLPRATVSLCDSPSGGASQLTGSRPSQLTVRETVRETYAEREECGAIPRVGESQEGDDAF